MNTSVRTAANGGIDKQLIAARVKKTGQQVMVDDRHGQIGLLVFYNPWHYDEAGDRWYHDEELDFIDQRLQ
jgi:hypothetical protein